MKKVFTLAAFVSMLWVEAQVIDDSKGIVPLIEENSIFYFHVMPSNSSGGSIDAFISLSQGTINLYDDASLILRFSSANGYIDVRDGGAYTKTSTVNFTLGSDYHCWFDIDFENETYDTYVQPTGQSTPTLIHSDAAFRKKNIEMLARWSSVHASGNNEVVFKNGGVVSSVGEMTPDWTVTGTQYGKLDSVSISDLPYDLQVSSFLDGLEYPKSATVSVLSSNSSEVSESEILVSGMKLQIQGRQTTTYSLGVRSVSDENNVITAFNASINNTNRRISGLYNDLTLTQFASGIQISPYASIRVIQIDPLTKDTSTVDQPDSLITNLQKVEITSESGKKAYYTISIGSYGMPSRTVANNNQSYNNVWLQKLDLSGSIEWHVKASENPLPGSILNLTSDDIWIYFDKIDAQTFYDNYFGHIRINGQAAVLGENVRLTQYSNGCVLISHGSDFKPLTAYSESNYGGTQLDFEIHTYYKTAELGTLNDNISSFILKKGYMATFAANTNGTGSSKVYIADKEDILVTQMPAELNDNISFVRVFPWRWSNKKGYDGSPARGASAADASWTYSHGGNGSNSSLNVEFVPIRHNPNWPSYSQIQAKENSTHALFFNEPDNSVDDGYSTVENAIAQYPNLLASGLRMVSPAPTDGGAWWVYEFLEQCEQNNYRVDAVAIHFYRGCQSTSQFYNFLKSIHDNTGLPIWVTEWANGCNWTSCNPTSYEENAEIISDWVEMLESAPFVERYVMWHGCTQYQQFFKNDGTRSPAGQFYYEYESRLSYQSEDTYDLNPFPSNNATEIDIDISLSWNKKPDSKQQILYFGDSYPPQFKSHIEANSESLKLDKLEYGKTYYWRVDELQGSSIVKGEELEFKTIEFIKPYSPIPSIAAEDVIDRNLSWKSDSVKTEVHYLYIGTSKDDLKLEVALLDQLTSYEATKLEKFTEYFWRVDEHLTLRDGSKIVIEGDVWSFTTGNILSVEENTANKFEVFPNPMTSTLSIKGIAEGDKVEIFNLLGVKVVSQKYESRGLDVSHLPKGMYIVKVAGYEPAKVIK